MKYLVVFAVVFVALWLWRKNRREEIQSRRPPQKASAAGAPRSMVRCAHCGLHLPAADALSSADGATYCSTAHRNAHAR